MAYPFMKFEVRDNVAWITFNQPAQAGPFQG